ncbi:MAG TPA: DUF4870 domain-containing protein [Pyrinomonadaceae bacterium]|nr:DUF4870 domain-containing protein [Pyrinomonadaceae bacterium]
MQNPPPVQTAKSSTGLDENVAALLAYVFTWLSGLIFFLIEKESRLVRFHAMQALLLGGSAIVIGIVLWVVWVVLLIIVAQISDVLTMLLNLVFGLLMLAFYIGLLIAWVMCMIKAYGKQYFKLPIIGNMAEKFSTK